MIQIKVKKHFFWFFYWIGCYKLEIKNKEERTCLIASLGIGEAPWINQWQKPQIFNSKTKYEKKRLTIDNAPIGKDIPSLEFMVTAERAK